MKLSLVRPSLVAFVLPVSLLFGAGCGAGANESKPSIVFPTSAELAQLPSVKPPASAFSTNDVAVDEWSFAAAPSNEGMTYEDASPWGALLREIVSARGASVSFSAALRCAADEIARFALKNGALPAESLRRFTIARCGGITPNATPIFVSGQVPASMTDDEVVAAMRPKLTEMIGHSLGKGPHAIGLAVARAEGRIVVAAVVGAEEARLEPGSQTIDAARNVTVRGTVRGDVASVTGVINQGENASKACDSDPMVVAPRFALTCHVAEGDTSAWLSILARNRGRLLASNVADILVHDGDASALTYKVHSAGTPAPVKTPADFTASLLNRLNAVRARAKLAPLALSRRQSVENARLAGTLVDASLHDDAALADRIAIGLLAGWSVDGTIRTGNFLVLDVAPTNDATAWLDFALERPFGRTVLLDPAARHIAIGPAIPDGVSALGAAVTTYALFESTTNHQPEEARVLKSLANARALHHAAGVSRVGGIDELAAEAALVHDKGKRPLDALQEVLDAIVSRTGKAVQGYVLESSDLDALPFPDALLGAAPLNVALAVTHHRAEGAAWGQYVVFLIAIDPAATVPAPGMQARRMRTAEEGDPGPF